MPAQASIGFKTFEPKTVLGTKRMPSSTSHFLAFSNLSFFLPGKGLFPTSTPALQTKWKNPQSWIETNNTNIQKGGGEMSVDNIVPKSAQLKLMATCLVKRQPMPCNTGGSHGIICQSANLTEVYLENFLHPVICSRDHWHEPQIVGVACSRNSSKDSSCV